MALNADSITHGPWWKGVRYDIPVEEVGTDELSDMENTRVGSGGQVAVRPGTLSYKSASAISGTPTITMAAEYDQNATTTHVVIVAGNAIYKYDSGWSAITGSVTVTAADDNTFQWANCNGTLVATNGADTDAWKWTGSSNATVLDDDGRFTKGKHLAWWDNRLWIGNVNGATNQLWYSDTADIETWDATSFINFGGIVTGITPSQSALVVHTDDGIYTLTPTGNSVVPYKPLKRTQRSGLDGRSCITLPNDVQMLVREDGIYAWSGGSQITKISQALDGGYWPNINTARLHKAFAGYFPREKEVWFALPYGGAGQTNMNHVMVLGEYTDTESGQTLHRWHGPYTGWERNCFALIDQKPHLGGFSGVLWDHDDSGYDDGTSAINASFETGGTAPLGDDLRVKWLNARHLFDGQGDYSITVSQSGSDLSGTTQSLNIDGGGFILDQSSLDLTKLYVSRQVPRETALQGFGPHASLKISMNANDQTFSHRKIMMRFKPLGRYRTATAA